MRSLYVLILFDDFCQLRLLFVFSDTFAFPQFSSTHGLYQIHYCTRNSSGFELLDSQTARPRCHGNGLLTNDNVSNT